MPFTHFLAIVAALVIGFVLLGAAKRRQAWSDDQTRAYARRAAWGVLACIVWAASTILGSLFSEDYALARHGRETVAVVTALDVETSRSRSMRTSSSYFVHYRFDANGRVHSHKDRLDLGRGYADLAVGDALPVVYDTRDPDRSRAVIARPFVGRVMMVVFVAGMAWLAFEIGKRLTLVAFALA